MGQAANPYAALLDATRDTLTARAARYRSLVVVVSLLTLAGFAFAWTVGSLGGVALWALLPGAVLAFTALDARAVDQWRALALQPWVQGTLSLGLLISTVRKVPGLPVETIEGMLGTLPNWSDSAIPRPAREALAALQVTIGRTATAAQALRCAVGVAAGIAAMASLLMRSAWPLTAWLVLPAAAALMHRALDAKLARASKRGRRDVRAAAKTDTAAALWLSEVNLEGLSAPAAARLREQFGAF